MTFIEYWFVDQFVVMSSVRDLATHDMYIFFIDTEICDDEKLFTVFAALSNVTVTVPNLALLQEKLKL